MPSTPAPPQAAYLVTGAAGFIGSHSVDRLLADGHYVVGVDNLRTGNAVNLDSARAHGARFRFVDADVADAERLDALFREHRFAGVLHLAALVSVPESIERPDENAVLNLYASDALARLCVRYRCPRIVFASSAAVYGNSDALPNRETDPPRPLSPYAGAKLAGEAMLLAYAASYGLRAVCFRYFNVYGPRQDPGSPYSGVLSIFSQRLRQGLPVTVYGDGEQTRDFVAVADVAAANARALTADVPGGVFNLCRGEGVSLNSVLERCRAMLPGAPPPAYCAARGGDIRHSRGAPERLNQVFGFVADTPFERGLRRLLGG